MKKFVICLLFGIATLNVNAVLIGSNFDRRDIEILKELDIEPSYITDYELQKTFTKFSYSQDGYKERLSDATLFVPMVKNILRNEGVPSSFLYLAMAESNFTINAKSRVKAMGMWQFMPETGKVYGLDNNLYVDERMDFVKSTYAATKYLNKMHKEFGKWYLAAMAYNAGQGRVIEALTRATIDMYEKQNPKERKKEISQYRKIISQYQKKQRGYKDLDKVYQEVIKWGVTPDIFVLMKVQKNVKRQYVPFETRNYIRKIVALGMMNGKSFISNENGHLLNLGDNASSVAQVKAKGGIHLQSVANSIGIEYDELRKLNLHIKKSIVPPYEKEYDIYIPYNKLSAYYLNKDKIKNDKFLIYNVKAGDSLLSIGNKYKISYNVIKDFNKLKTNSLSINQKLLIPSVIENENKTKNIAGNIKNNSYYVKKGDTLYDISKKFNVSVDKIKRANSIKNNIINIGDKLVFN